MMPVGIKKGFITLFCEPVNTSLSYSLFQAKYCDLIPPRHSASKVMKMSSVTVSNCVKKIEPAGCDMGVTC